MCEETSTLEQFHSESRPELETLSRRGLARAEVERMQALAVAMRKLIRVKIADDADLDQARSAVDVLLGFFENLATASAARGVSEFEMLRALD